MKKNSGPGKKYPGGPTCKFKGKAVPCLVRWTEKGSITSAIMVDILRTLEKLGVYLGERAQGKLPCLLLDGHGTRLELPFLAYVNDAEHQWVACIGVPYGTALWQVGDSTKQNGCYKMAVSSCKKQLMQKRQKLMMSDMTICPYEVMIIVNHAWAKSFARRQTNA